MPIEFDMEVNPGWNVSVLKTVDGARSIGGTCFLWPEDGRSHSEAELKRARIP